MIGFHPLRRVGELQRHANVRDSNLRDLDLTGYAELLPTVSFNLRTRWPTAGRMPQSPAPGIVLTNAMDPGLGIRLLHRQGITGAGISVAIIDYPILGRHPEYAAAIQEIHSVGNANGSSMHGPAVASLLVGRSIGTAPGAKLYYVATPDPGMDARFFAEGLDWIIRKNQMLPAGEKIRVVSVSAGPSGPGSVFRNGNAWDAARARAEEAGILVIDGTVHGGFTGPCLLDPNANQDVFRCRPIPTQRGPGLFADRLLVPVSPRTVAEEYRNHAPGYMYCGIMNSTLGMFGTSWSMPYCSGVAALGFQVRPDLTPAAMKQRLFSTAFVLPNGSRVINPLAFIEDIRSRRTGQ